MLSRVTVAAVLLGAVFALFWAENILLWQAATLLPALLAAREWAKLSGLRTAESLVFTLLFAVFALGGGWLLDSDAAARDAFLGAVAVFWVAVAPWLMLKQWRLGGVVFGFLGMVILFSAWYSAAVLFATDARFLLLVLGVVWVADSAAFVVGKLLGRAQMAPFISPGKTWEGFCGGLLAVLAGALYWNFYRPTGLSTAWLLVAVFALTVLATVGDLFESYFKRQAGVKDSGTILGGHGGVLDRLDAALPVLPVSFLLAHGFS